MSTSEHKAIAVIADIHGNCWALDAVLDDIRSRDIEEIFNLGDNFSGPLAPARTADRLLSLNLINISGNQDRQIVHPTEEIRQLRSYQFAMTELSSVHLDWLKTLPFTLVYDDILLCHGTPFSDETYLLERVTENGVSVDDNEALTAKLNGIQQAVILCGHSHVPHTVWLANGQLIVNPGSVGLPAYTEDSPFPHAMQSYSPHAHYAILHKDATGYGVEHVAVPYAWDQAAAVAKQNHREDWSSWLASGRA